MTKKKKERSSAPKLGATYQAAKLGLQVGGPVAYQALTDRSQAGFEFRLRSSNYHKGVAVSLLDAWGSKKLGHAAAISRKSITAIAPEFLAGADAAERANLDPIGSGANFIENTSGYNPAPDSFNVSQAKGYFIQKYGLGIGRKVARALVPGVYDMVNSALGKMGVHV